MKTTLKIAKTELALLFYSPIAWFLLVSGFTLVIRRWSRAVDAQVLRQHTHVAAGFWAYLWLIGAALCLVFGTSLLV